MREDYAYNVLAVDKSGVIIEILLISNSIPSFRDEMTLRCKKTCPCCNNIIPTSNYILAGSFNVGDKIV